MINGIPTKHPVTVISLVALCLVGFFLGVLLTLIFMVSTLIGFVVLVIYIILGVFGYRLAQIQTKQRKEESNEYD